MKEAGISSKSSRRKRHRAGGINPPAPCPRGAMKSLEACNSEPRGETGVSDCEFGHKGGMGIFIMVKGAFYGNREFAPREFLKNSEKAFRSAWKKIVKKSLTKFSENSKRNFLLKKSGKNILTHSQIGSVEAVRSVEKNYNFRGRDGDFPPPSKNR